MTQYNLGRVCPIFQGDFDPNVSYGCLDVVLYEGSSYVAKMETLGNLPSDSNFWQLVASSGAGGITGVDAELSTTSENPVQNKVITLKINELENLVIPEETIRQIVEGYQYQNAEQVEQAIVGKGYQNAEQVEQAIVGKNFQTSEQVSQTIETAITEKNYVPETSFATINGMKITQGGNLEIQGGGGSAMVSEDLIIDVDFPPETDIPTVDYNLDEHTEPNKFYNIKIRVTETSPYIENFTININNTSGEYKYFYVSEISIPNGVSGLNLNIYDSRARIINFNSSYVELKVGMFFMIGQDTVVNLKTPNSLTDFENSYAKWYVDEYSTSISFPTPNTRYYYTKPITEPAVNLNTATGGDLYSCGFLFTAGPELTSINVGTYAETLQTFQVTPGKMYWLFADNFTRSNGYLEGNISIFEIPFGAGGGGSSVVVDDNMNLDSTNPVQNKVITARINEVESKISGGDEVVNIDETVSDWTLNPVEVNLPPIEPNKFYNVNLIYENAPDTVPSININYTISQKGKANIKFNVKMNGYKVANVYAVNTNSDFTPSYFDCSKKTLITNTGSGIKIFDINNGNITMQINGLESKINSLTNEVETKSDHISLYKAFNSNRFFIGKYYQDKLSYYEKPVTNAEMDITFSVTNGDSWEQFMLFTTGPELTNIHITSAAKGVDINIPTTPNTQYLANFRISAINIERVRITSTLMPLGSVSGEGGSGVTPEQVQEIINQNTNGFQTSEQVQEIINQNTAGYAKKADIATINGQVITEGGNITIEGGGAAVVVDSQLSTESENPVQNKVLTTRINELDAKIPTDTVTAQEVETTITSKGYQVAANIKTINGQSLTDGPGNIKIEGGYPNFEYRPSTTLALKQHPDFGEGFVTYDGVEAGKTYYIELGDSSLVRENMTLVPPREYINHRVVIDFSRINPTGIIKQYQVYDACGPDPILYPGNVYIMDQVDGTNRVYASTVMKGISEGDVNRMIDEKGYITSQAVDERGYQVAANIKTINGQSLIDGPGNIEISGSSVLWGQIQMTNDNNYLYIGGSGGLEANKNYKVLWPTELLVQKAEPNIYLYHEVKGKFYFDIPLDINPIKKIYLPDSMGDIRLTQVGRNYILPGEKVVIVIDDNLCYIDNDNDATIDCVTEERVGQMIDERGYQVAANIKTINGQSLTDGPGNIEINNAVLSNYEYEELTANTFTDINISNRTFYNVKGESNSTAIYTYGNPVDEAKVLLHMQAGTRLETDARITGNFGESITWNPDFSRYYLAFSDATDILVEYYKGLYIVTDISKSIGGSGVTPTQVQEIINQNTADFATNTKVNEVEAKIPTDTVTTEQLNAVKATAEGKTDMASVQTYITEQNFATKSELPTIPTNISEFTNDANYTTLATVQKEGYAKTTEIDEKLSKKADSTRVDEVVASIPTNTETWSFTLEDGSVVTKTVYVDII